MAGGLRVLCHAHLHVLCDCVVAGPGRLPRGLDVPVVFLQVVVLANPDLSHLSHYKISLYCMQMFKNFLRPELN